jgi:hypothetical protein
VVSDVTADPMPVPSGLPMPPGPPYRVPEPSLLPSSPFVAARRPRPVIGPALSVFAVLLWTFVVVGQFTTSWTMGATFGQGIALALVMLATFAAWVANLRRSRMLVPPQRTAGLVGRGIGIGALALSLFLACLAVATVAGSTSSKNHDFFIAFALIVVSTVAAIAGPRLTSPVRPERSHGSRFVLVVMWIAGALLTLVAAADLAANG